MGIWARIFGNNFQKKQKYMRIDFKSVFVWSRMGWVFKSKLTKSLKFCSQVALATFEEPYSYMWLVVTYSATQMPVQKVLLVAAAPENWSPDIHNSYSLHHDAWRVPRTGEPGGLPPMGSQEVLHDWSDLAAAPWCTEESDLRLCCSK